MRRVRLILALVLGIVLTIGPTAVSASASSWESVGLNGGILCANEYGGYVFCDESGCGVV